MDTNYRRLDLIAVAGGGILSEPYTGNLSQHPAFNYHAHQFIYNPRAPDASYALVSESEHVDGQSSSLQCSYSIAGRNGIETIGASNRVGLTATLRRLMEMVDARKTRGLAMAVPLSRGVVIADIFSSTGYDVVHHCLASSEAEASRFVDSRVVKIHVPAAKSLVRVC